MVYSAGQVDATGNHKLKCIIMYYRGTEKRICNACFVGDFVCKMFPPKMEKNGLPVLDKQEVFGRRKSHQQVNIVVPTASWTRNSLDTKFD